MRTKLTIPDTVDAPWMRQARRNFHTPNVGFSSTLPLPHQGALSAGTTPPAISCGSTPCGEPDPQTETTSSGTSSSVSLPELHLPTPLE